MRIGQYFKMYYPHDLDAGYATFILAQVGDHQVTLINIKTGNRWGNAIEVENPYDISESEWRRISWAGETDMHISPLVH